MSKTPKLRFKEFSGEWEEIRGCELFDILGGASFSSNHSSKEGVKWFKIANVGINKTNKTDMSYLPNSLLEEYNKYILKNGDIVLALTRPLLNSKLKICMIDDFFNGSLLNQRVGKIIPNNKINNIFIYYNIQTEGNIRYLENMISGTDPPNLSNGYLLMKKYSIPSIQEQEKISSFLSLVDDKISLQDEKVEALKDYKKGMMQKIFSRELRFKDDEGRDYPEWEEKKLKSILKEVSEKTKENNQYEVISSTTNGLFLQKEYFNREIASNDNTGYKIIKLNQVVLSPQNLWMGNINFNEKYDIGIVSPSYKIFDINDKFDSKYIGYILRTPRAFYEFMQSSEQGASIVRRNLNMDLFNEIYFDMPCKKEQVKIAKFIGSIDLKIEREQYKLDYLNEYKKGLLQQMFV